MHLQLVLHVSQILFIVSWQHLHSSKACIHCFLRVLLATRLQQVLRMWMFMQRQQRQLMRLLARQVVAWVGGSG
jgi:hypothetical protein